MWEMVSHGWMLMSCVFISHRPNERSWAENIFHFLVCFSVGKKELRHDSSRGGVAIVTDKTNPVTSTSLLLRQVRLSDSGKYSCTPSNADPASVTLHVLQGNPPPLIYITRWFISKLKKDQIENLQVRDRLPCRATEDHLVRSTGFSSCSFRCSAAGSIIVSSPGSRDQPAPPRDQFLQLCAGSKNKKQTNKQTKSWERKMEEALMILLFVNVRAQQKQKHPISLFFHLLTYFSCFPRSFW